MFFLLPNQQSQGTEGTVSVDFRLIAIQICYYSLSYRDHACLCRLVNELRGWVLGHEEELRRQRAEVQMEQAKQSRPRKKYYPPRKLKAALRGDDPADIYHPRYDLHLLIPSCWF